MRESFWGILESWNENQQKCYLNRQHHSVFNSLRMHTSVRSQKLKNYFSLMAFKLTMKLNQNAFFDDSIIVIHAKTQPHTQTHTHTCTPLLSNVVVCNFFPFLHFIRFFFIFFRFGSDGFTATQDELGLYFMILFFHFVSSNYFYCSFMIFRSVLSEFIGFN